MVAHPEASVLIPALTCGVAVGTLAMRDPSNTDRSGGGEALEPGVVGLIRRAERIEERPPVPLVLPAVDRQEPAGPGRASWP